ncbi:hypothetical protein HCH_07027 [Hahella chejuensis KCTC 2396]|uniref:Lipoprotein n=1 Tax=Hahella chejuensis (strain KCTC 2396) TaxID=349521 RepID=Q2S6T3_HAHCH|nr:hypothetical protein [Hahella chejuensis]ABC33641.1 hypothetical protein HCH_07027 [Hahella chejuensis KCTC 2396]
MSPRRYPVLTALALGLSACVADPGIPHPDSGLVFSHLRLQPEITDLNGFRCQPVNKTDLNHILQTGEFVSHRQIHDEYSISGCSVTGTLSINGSATPFSFDYSGIFYFADGRILACGEACCDAGFEHCGWYDPEAQE